MCTVIVGWRLFPDAPVVMAANRDELLARPSDPPLKLSDDPQRWGGRDRLAGGTWLAVDPAGRIGAVTNRHPGGRPPARDSTRSSRGRLPLDVLAGDDPPDDAWLQSLQAHDYNPVNVIYVSPASLLWVAIDDTIGRRTERPAPGVHVITEQDLDDVADTKTAMIRRGAAEAARTASDADAVIESWRDILRSHEAPSGVNPACIHGDVYGTVSSATLIIDAGGSVRYAHAEGPPCVSPFLEVLPGPS